MGKERMWNYRAKSRERAQILAQNLGLSEYIAQLLVNRSILTIEEAKKFLYPELINLDDPFYLPDMESAVYRILNAINNGERILIYGDYDVDGITSTALLTDFLRKQGAMVEYYIPERLGEGYGLNKDSLLWAKERLNCSLIITVDCGISAVSEVEAAKAYGLDIIITDHHEPGLVKPSAIAVVNPKLAHARCFRHYAGVGVAFKLVQALAIKLGLSDMYTEKFLDLAALGTIADVVPLIGENRILVKHGLDNLNKLRRVGLKALVEVAGLAGKELNTCHVAFGLAPRLNAVGRLGNASPAVDLLITDCEQVSHEVAKKLNKENSERQLVEAQIYKEVCERIEKEIDLTKEKVIVLGSEFWHSGVIGIVASKIVEKYYRPTILLAIEGEYAKGSGRSIDNFDLFKALQHCESILERYGGHYYAAGLTVKTRDIDNFCNIINEYAKVHLSPELLIPSQGIDLAIDFQDINNKFICELKKLEPFGAANPEPIFYARKMHFENCREVGKQANHLKCKVSINNISLDAIGFNLANLLSERIYNPCKEADAIFSLQENTWDGNNYIQLNLKDINSTPLFRELFHLNVNLTDFWNDSFSNLNIVRVPLRKIGSWLSFIFEDLLALKKITLIKLDGQLNYKLDELDSKKVVILTEPFYDKYETFFRQKTGKILNYRQFLKEKPASNNIVDYRGSNKKQILDEFIKQDKKIFIICNYKESAELLREQLSVTNPELNPKSIKVLFTKEDLYDFIINRNEVQIVISNQLLELYTWYNFDIKIIYEAPFSQEELSIRTKNFSNSQIVLLWNDEDLIYNRDVLHAMFPDTSFLNQLVKILEQTKEGEPLVLQSLKQQVKVLNESVANIFITAGLKIFEELGLVIKKGGALFCSIINDKSINWERSACFLEGLKEKKAFDDFANSPLQWKENMEVI